MRPASILAVASAAAAVFLGGPLSLPSISYADEVPSPKPYRLTLTVENAIIQAIEVKADDRFSVSTTVGDTVWKMQGTTHLNPDNSMNVDLDLSRQVTTPTAEGGMRVQSASRTATRRVFVNGAQKRLISGPVEGTSLPPVALSVQTTGPK